MVAVPLNRRQQELRCLKTRWRAGRVIDALLRNNGLRLSSGRVEDEDVPVELLESLALMERAEGTSGSQTPKSREGCKSSRKWRRRRSHSKK